MDRWWIAPGLQPMPDWMAIGAERVFRDVQNPEPIKLQAGLSSIEPEFLWVVAGSEGGPSGFWLEHARPGEEFVARFADFLQDQVFDQLEETWGEAKPPCPGHPHPALAAELSGEAWWICPTSEARIARIGEYGNL